MAGEVIKLISDPLREGGSTCCASTHPRGRNTIHSPHVTPVKLVPYWKSPCLD